MQVYDDLITRLRNYAEWAEGNEWETPIMLSDDLKSAVNAIVELQTMVAGLNETLKGFAKDFPQWNSAKEPPKHDDDVLVFFAYGALPIVGYDVDRYNHKAKRFINYENNVTHWMKLPPPPQEEQNGTGKASP